MRIVIITDSEGRSGGARQAVYQAQGLADRGHDVTLCLPHASNFWELPGALENPLWFKLPPSPRDYRKAVTSLLPEDPHVPTVVHAFHNKAVKRLAWWGLFWRNRNLVCVAHRGVIFRPGNPLPYWSPAMKAFIVNSEACAKALRWHCPRGKIYLVDNGVPDSRVTPTVDAATIRAELRLPADRFTFVYVGNDNPVKGTDTLLEAFARANLPGTQLLTVGVRKERWNEICVQSGIADRVYHVGIVEHVCNYLQLGDAFVFPSRGMDSAPNTLLEAIRMGLPTIATAIGGAPEIAAFSGPVIPPNSVPALTEALRAMVVDRQQYARWKAGSMQRSKHFSVENRCEELERIYNSLLPERQQSFA